MALDSNQRQTIPELFVEIMRHDCLEPILPTPLANGVLPFGPWARWRRDHKVWRERKLELVNAAEKMLRWNTDKGNLG